MVKIAFLSNGCESSFSRPREIIAAYPDCREVKSPERADILMVNFCAISAESLNAFESFRREVIGYKKANPELKIIAGGCIEGLSEKKDLSFADAIFRHQEEADVFATFLGKAQPASAPAVLHGYVGLQICWGCNRRCAFCKVHFLDHMHLTSRPMDEILGLAEQAIAQGINTIAIVAENSTEWGLDIGSNFQTLLERLLALDGLRILDVNGVCSDEITPGILQALRHPKVRIIQLETQSLDDQIRKNMNLRKTSDEVLDILDALSDKFIISNLMLGFPGHSISEFNREMRKIRTHHLYYLSLNVYDDTPGLPSHKLYRPVDKDTMAYYTDTFIRTVAKERQILLNRLTHLPYIEALVITTGDSYVCLYALHYTVMIHVEHPTHRYRHGDVVRVKITGIHENIVTSTFFSEDTRHAKQLKDRMQYFDTMDKNQIMSVDGKIIGFMP